MIELAENVNRCGGARERCRASQNLFCEQALSFETRIRERVLAALGPPLAKAFGRRVDSKLSEYSYFVHALFAASRLRKRTIHDAQIAPQRAPNAPFQRCAVRFAALSGAVHDRANDGDEIIRGDLHVWLRRDAVAR